MNYQDLFARFGGTDTPARAGLIGVGQFGNVVGADPPWANFSY